MDLELGLIKYVLGLSHISITSSIRYLPWNWHWLAMARPMPCPCPPSKNDLQSPNKIIKMRQSQSESAAIASSSSNASQNNRPKGAEAVQLGPVSEEEHRRMSKASTATGGADEPVIGGGTEMGEAIMEMVRPAVERLDEQVKNTRKSQLLLATHIEQLSTRLKGIVDDQILPYDLDVYVRKLEDSRKRVSNVNQRLQALHGRMSQLQRNIARETYKQRHQPQQQQHAPQ